MFQELRCDRWWLCIVWCLCGLSMLSGCQTAYFLVDPEKSETVKAEYGKIGNRRLAVLVWVDRSTLDEYPRSQRQVCQALTYHMKQHLPEARLVPARKVDAFQRQTNPNWQGLSNNEICKALQCDLLLKVDLLVFTARANDSRQLHKASVAATINMYECGQVETVDSVYEDEITIKYPPDTLHGSLDMSESDLLHEAVEHFAEVMARKFYDHKIKINRRPRR